MPYPTTPISTTNLDAGSDSVASARADLLALAQSYNSLLASIGGVSGVCPLDASGKVALSHLPALPGSVPPVVIPFDFTGYAKAFGDGGIEHKIRNLEGRTLRLDQIFITHSDITLTDPGDDSTIIYFSIGSNGAGNGDGSGVAEVTLEHDTQYYAAAAGATVEIASLGHLYIGMSSAGKHVNIKGFVKCTPI